MWDDLRPARGIVWGLLISAIIWAWLFVALAHLAHAQNVTPFVCPVTAVASGGTAVSPLSSRVNGGYIWNLSTNSATLFVNPVTTATTTEGLGNYPLLPGGSPYYIIPGSSEGLSVNSASAESFGCVFW
jgi:hypothetical protein